MKVLVTGASSGIGKSCAIFFLEHGHEVFGIDKLQTSLSCKKYRHFIADVSSKETLPKIEDVEIVVNNAGIQTASMEYIGKDIAVNLQGAINVAEFYAFQPHIKSLLFNASVSGVYGDEFPEYVASKAGVIGYMKNCAIRLSKEFKATCNAVCLGGVLTELNAPVIKNKTLWNRIMDVTPLKRWMTPEEVSEWIYFLTVTNKACTGQAIVIDNGEHSANSTFVWPNF